MPKNKRVIKAEIGNEEWQVIFVPTLGDHLHGECDHDDRKILVSERAVGKLQLDTLIHECLHAAFPWMREFMVNLIAEQLAKILWKRGYRRVK